MAKSQLSSKTGVLSAISADPGTEIFVTNHRFEMVARGVDIVNATLAPGLYKVRFRAGLEMRDVLTEVTAGPQPTTVTIEPLKFASAAPIARTSTTHEFQRDPARSLSQGNRTRAEKHSELMLFVRDPEGDDSNVDLSSVHVRQVDGSEIVGEGLISGDDPQARYTGWNRPVEPGTYRVRVATGKKGSYEMFVIAWQAWQTLVFLVAEDFPHQGDIIRRPALRSASVMMCRPDSGFDPEDPIHRLAEKARSALQYGRPAIWTGVVEPLVNSKFENPMLGIFGLHLGLLAKKPDTRLLTTVVKNLTGIIPHHPDVDAVRYDVRLPKNLRDQSMRFETPPMLRSSWNLIVAATAQSPSMVPAGSLIDRIAEHQVPRGPWLLARVSETKEPGAFLDGRYARARFKELGKLVNDPARRGRLRERLAAPDALAPFERDLLDGATIWTMEGAEGSEAKPIGQELTLKQLIARLKVPACTIARTSTALIEWAT